MSSVVSPSPLPDTRGHRILVCLDRSTFSEGCVPFAVSLARTFGSDITLAHIMQPHLQAGGRTNDALGWEISRQEARAYLERIEKEVTFDLGKPIDLRLEQGRPAERIVDLAREIGADLTVIGSRGKGGTAARSLGSTAQQVLSLAQTSVFIAPSSSPASTSTPKRILVPLDGSLRTESVLPTAVRLANAHGAELLLVHVVQDPVPTALLRETEDLELARKLAARIELGAARYLKDLANQLAHEISNVRTLVSRHANAQQGLLEISEKERSELVVLSAHGSACDSAQSFGSVTAYLLTHAAVPLLVLQDLPETPVDRGAIEIDERPTPPSLRASYAPENR